MKLHLISLMKTLWSCKTCKWQANFVDQRKLDHTDETVKTRKLLKILETMVLSRIKVIGVEIGNKLNLNWMDFKPSKHSYQTKIFFDVKEKEVLKNNFALSNFN